MAVQNFNMASFATTLIVVLLLCLSPSYTQACSLNPVAQIASPVNDDIHYTGEAVLFNGSGSVAMCGTISNYVWRVRNGGFGPWTQVSTSPTYWHTFTNQRSSWQVQLQVHNSVGRTHTRTVTGIHVNNATEGQCYLTDHLGSVRAVVNRDGDLLSWTDYYPFGLPIPTRSVNSSNAHDMIKFTGYEAEDEGDLGWYHAEARTYDPFIGRFTSVDPMASERTWLSSYNYSQNNPLSRIDPTGMLDEYYDENGIYLGDDELDTDYIWITSKENYDANVASGGAAIQENSTAITSAKLTSEGWSNLFTDVFGKAGYDTAYLLNGQVSVAGYKLRDAGMGISQEYLVEPFNGPSNGQGIMNMWMSESHHAILTLNTREGQISTQLGTVANIQSSFVHEMRHYKEMRALGRAMNFGAGGEIRAYREQMNHPTFLRTTSRFQNFIMSNCREYGGCKN